MPESRLSGKRWKREFEDEIREGWRDKKAFKFHPGTRKPIYSIDTPPPYVNTPVHMGHATTYTIMDMIARFKRMTGFEVLFPLGLDRNGLPIEVAAEQKFNVSISQTPREKFIELCKKLLEDSSLESIESFYKLGHSYTSWDAGTGIGDLYYTDSEDYRKLTQSTFIDLWEKGLIYIDKKVNNYCPVCRTTIADSEIEYKNISSTFNYVKFKIKGTRDTVIIGTTRPELIGACGMIIFNPKDERYKKLEGKTAITPLYEKEVPIRAHPYAKIEAGTGLMMMCSFGDYTDIRFFREMDLEPVILINSRGQMNENAGFLEGMSIQEARKDIIRRLEDRGLLEKQEKIMHRTPVCERSKTEIEFIAMSEYYLKQLDFKPEMKKIARKTDFYSPRSRQILLDWINSLSMDWAISRRRYYATEIPLWYCKECSEPIVPPKGRYYKPWKEKPPIEKCHRCGCIEFEPETRVFDTWFDSSISPLYILKYHTNENFFKRTEPCSLRPQGKEIVRTWLYYTLLRAYQLTSKPVFRNVWIHYHVLDEKGFKMSKSLGNVIDPLEVIEKFGAEPFRIWCALEGDITTSDLKCSFARIEGASKFLTKLWNVARFVSMFKPNKKGIRFAEADRWILKELDRLVKKTRNCYERYDFHSPIVAIKHFIWETFASHYIELVKSRAYNEKKRFTKVEQKAAIYTLNKVLEEILVLLHPIACFITHRIYKDVFREDIEKKKFPKTDSRLSKTRLPFKTEELLALNSRIWKRKKDRGLSLKASIKHATIPSKFKRIEKDLKEAHNIEDLKYGKRFNIRI